MLDFDATDDPVHGHQPGGFFHGYYDHYCFFAVVRIVRSAVAGGLPSSFEPGRFEARLGDTVFVGREVASGMAWGSHRVSGGLGVLPTPDCERHGVRYIVGLARNRMLEREAAACEMAKDGFEATLHLPAENSPGMAHTTPQKNQKPPVSCNIRARPR